MVQPRPALCALILAFTLIATPASSAPSPAELANARRLETRHVIDLAASGGACPSGVWTGEVVFHNTAQGTLTYWGTGVGCAPHGIGTIQYADGSTYFGAIASTREGSATTPPYAGLRPAQREGKGQWYDPRSGRRELGEFRADRLVRDLSADAAFLAAYQAASDSVTDRAAPRLTPQTAALMSARPAAPATRSAAVPGPAGSSASPRFLPAVLQSLEGMAELEATLARFAKRPANTLTSTIKSGFFSDKCLAKAGEELVLPVTAALEGFGPSRGYVGEHTKCLPSGVGRIDFADGGIWIGAVSHLRSRTESNGGIIPSNYTDHRSPVPDGLGMLRLADGRRVVLDWRYSPPKKLGFGSAGYAGVGSSRMARWVAVLWQDGAVTVYDDRDPMNNHGGSALWYSDIGTQIDRSGPGYQVLKDGTIIRGTFRGRDLQCYFDGPKWLGVRVASSTLGIQVDGTYEECTNPQRWQGVFRVRLDRPHGGYQPGFYMGDVAALKLQVPVTQPLDLLVPGLTPLSEDAFRVNYQRFDQTATRYAEMYRKDIVNKRDAAARQAAAEEAQWRAEERARQEESNAAFHSAMMGAMGGLKQTFDQSAAEMEASRQRTQAVIDQANALAAQQAEQDRRNREEQARRDREARAGEQAYTAAQAQSKAAFANAMDAAKQQQAQDAARNQAQAASMQQQLAQGGAYRSPYETGARTGSGGSPSGVDSASSAPSLAAPSTRGSPVPSECVVEGERRPGSKCGNPNSLSIEHRYVCGGKASVRVCLSTPKGDDCGSQTLSEGESIWYYVCDFTGAIDVNATTAN